MLARLEAQVAEQQRFAANASHELRTPLAITQTLLDVARNDPTSNTRELVERLDVVNTRAIDLTEALLLLGRADQGSFTRERVDLSLIAEDATETLLPFADKHGVTIEVSGDMTPTIGSHTLLLQMTTNLVHNAIVHNLPRKRRGLGHDPSRAQECGAHRREHRRDAHAAIGGHVGRAVSSAEPNASAPTTPAWASAWQSSRASPVHTTEPSRLVSRPGGGLRVTVQLPVAPSG